MYPDVTVVCGKQQFARDDVDAIVNPVVIVEVLSDSTEASDRGEKFAHVQRLSSLQEYVLVSQRTQRVEVFRRGQGSSWVLNSFVSGDFTLSSIDATLSVDAMYANPIA